MSKKKVFFVADKATEAEFSELLKTKKKEILSQFTEVTEDNKVCVNIIGVRGRTPNQLAEVLKNNKAVYVVFEPCAKEIVAGIIQSLQKKMKEKMPLVLGMKNTKVEHPLVQLVTQEDFIALLRA